MESAAFWTLIEANLYPLRDAARSLASSVFKGTRLQQLYSGNDLLDEAILRLERSAPMKAAIAQRPEDLPHIMKVIMRNFAYDLLRGPLGRTDSIDVSFSPVVAHDGFCSRIGAGESLKDTTCSPEEQLEKQDQLLHLHLALEAMGKDYPDSAFILAYSLEVDEPNVDTGNCHRAKAEELGISSLSYRQHRFQGIRRLRTTYRNFLN